MPMPESEIVRHAIIEARRYARLRGLDWRDCLYGAYCGIRRAAQATDKFSPRKAAFQDIVDTYRIETGIRTLRGQVEHGTLSRTLVAPEMRSNPDRRALAIWCETAPQRAMLPMRVRIRLYLICVEGWTQTAIAELEGVSQSTISWNLTYQLRRLLDAEAFVAFKRALHEHADRTRKSVREGR